MEAEWRCPAGQARGLKAFPQRLAITIDGTPDESGVLTLARRHRLTVYDAAYLELAVRNALPLATLDAMREARALIKIARGLALIFHNRRYRTRDCRRKIEMSPASPVECHMKRSGFGSIRGANAPPMGHVIRGGAIWPILNGEVPIIGQKAVIG